MTMLAAVLRWVDCLSKGSQNYMLSDLSIFKELKQP
jgi:hypothetical protein